ncbi:MAG: GspE/PulE family protein [Planctomycetaceae bacterium]|nr:GspE/PulE family protein [Planctomycetaceae bacterium]
MGLAVLCSAGLFIRETPLWGLAEGALPFSPYKTIFFIGWFYLCLYSVQRSDNSPLIPDKYRYASNVAALMIGPLHLWVLFIAETVRKVQEGELTWGEVFSHVLDTIMERPIRNRPRKTAQTPAIQLMDTSGKRFEELYAKQLRETRDRRIQESTEAMVLSGITQRATDILIDPKDEAEYTIRFRVDGFLRVHETVDGKLCNAMINSLKAIAGMDIAEKRRPQDGAFRARIPEGDVYFRMATSGVLGGEKLAIRVLDQTHTPMGLNDVGFSPEQVKTLNRIVQQPQGMILVCGPTGSGKTTTLYAMLQTINFQERNVISIEDPIEHVMPHISQIEINTKAGVTFATSLRSILRQDPDVICVGEIRDAETAQIAIQAAQTGHLVLATLHASSNMAAMVRLMDLSVKPLLLSSALSVVISQRLIRRLCNYCKGPAELSQSQVEYCRQNNVDRQTILKANGCGHCGGTGYFGRTAIIDVMYMNDRISKLLCNNQLTPGDMKQQGDRSFTDALRREGMQRVLAGKTTLSEVKRITANLG